MPDRSDALQAYQSKRDFSKTPEPRGTRTATGRSLTFVVQKHDARRLHYDFRLELNGVLLSWAVPRGPSLDPRDKRMAVRTEDHPLSYAAFEGEIPSGHYGAGRVIVWDTGSWEPIGDAGKGLAAGKLAFLLHGQKLSGAWELIRIRSPQSEKESWLLFKKRDAQARPREDVDIVQAQPESVLRRRAERSATGKATAAPRRSPQRGSRTRGWPTAAVRRPLPESLSPQLATAATRVPAYGEWRFEVKYDGYRLLARVEGGSVRLITRSGQDWTARLPAVRTAVESLHLPSAWLDGEIVVMGKRGVPDFNALQKAFDQRSTQAIRYYLFDAPFLDGYDLRSAPLHERRELLRQLLRDPVDATVQFSADLDADADSVLAAACRMHLEGVIAKRIDAPYVSKRSESWLKLKCRQRQEFVIVGFRDRGGQRNAAAIGALLLGVHDDNGRLISAGSVGTGWDQATAVELKKRLLRLEVETPRMNQDGMKSRPRRSSPPAGAARWVEPRLVAEVQFSEWTPAGRIRQGSFVGLRSDLPAAAVAREGGRATGRRKRTVPPKNQVRGRIDSQIRVSHPDRIIDAESGATKLDLLRYYADISAWILPQLRGRPCSLLRAPAGLAGKMFFQKHADRVTVPFVTVLDAELWPDHQPLLEVATRLALLSAAQMNVIEFHTWNARTRQIDSPDRIVFDLDPGEGVPWKKVREAAMVTRALLTELRLKAWLKTSGGKGLHVVVPISTEHEPATVAQFSKAFVTHMVRVIPDRFVARSGAANRVGRIFVDYLRNSKGATTVAAYSARARAGLGVSMPVDWDDLDGVKSGNQWTIRTAPEHVARRSADPWRRYAQTKQSLTPAIQRLAAANSRA